MILHDNVVTSFERCTFESLNTKASDFQKNI